MKVSYNWLQDYVDFDYSPEELARELTMAGLEVDKIEYQGAEIKDIIVGQVKTIQDHQNADKLSVCDVDVGSDTKQIVCGADNMSVGDKVPVAPVGTEIPEGMKIEATELRGVESNGMMCSTEELNLPNDGVDGLYILPKDATVGKKLVEELNLDDVILEIDLTPNYAHCLSMVGVAREVAAITNNEVQYPNPRVEEIPEKIKDWINIEIKAEDLCSRYAGRVITNVEVKESPNWLKQKLEKAGIRPVNNVVDVTNFVLMELGLPLHPFDYNQLEEQKIVVRRPKPGEKLVTLDDEERDLNDDMLLIADANKPVCIAGVMGGANSEVTAETNTVFLEGANFDRVSVRKTAQQLGIHSEASHRFERGVDINAVELALDRAAELIAEVGSGAVIGGINDVYPESEEKQEIKLRPARVRKVLGLDLAKINIKTLLERLHFTVEDKGKNLLVKVPSYRIDVTQEVDLIEEVARIYGYDNVNPETLETNMARGKKTWKQKVEDETRTLLSDLGLYEAQNYSFIHPSAFDRLRLDEDSQLREAVKLSNPISEEHTILRTTLVPSILKNLAVNNNRNLEEIKLFELGKVYQAVEDKKLPEENLKLAAAVASNDFPDYWQVGAPGFFYLKGTLEDYFSRLGVNKVEFSTAEVSYLHPGRTAEVKIAGEKIGYLGELHPNIQEDYELEERATICELEFTPIMEAATFDRNYEQIPKYPPLQRDIALVASKEISNRKIKEVINKVGGNIIETIELFDVYEGEQIPDGYRSLAYSLDYRTPDRTLTDEEVNKVQAEIETELDEKLDVKIRQ